MSPAMLAAPCAEAQAAKPAGKPMPVNTSVETRETLSIESWFKDLRVHGSFVACWPEPAVPVRYGCEFPGNHSPYFRSG